MPSRFAQSAPPSIDNIYNGLPIGPFGVPPFIKADRQRRSHGRMVGMVPLQRLAGLAVAPRSWLRGWTLRARTASILAASDCGAIRTPCP